MNIRDISNSYKYFEELEGGAIFKHGGQYYCKLDEAVYGDASKNEGVFNAVCLYDGCICNIADRALVETLAGHTLEIADGMEGRT